MNRFQDGVRYLASSLILTGAYFLTARLSSHYFAVPPVPVSPLWPPAALAVLACLAGGLRMVPAVWLGAMLALLPFGLSLPAAALGGVGPALEAGIIAFLVQRRFHARTEFIYRGSISRFVGVVLLSAMLGASFGTAGIAIGNSDPSPRLALNWLTWWLGDATGVIIGVPLLLAWNLRTGVRWDNAKRAEAAAFLLLLLPTLAFLAFSDFPREWPVVYLAIPFVLWAAFRFNFAAVNWTSALVCGSMTWTTAHGTGPFAGEDHAASLVFLMMYIGAIGTIGLTLANLIHQRREAESALRTERDSLERRVRERTAALRADVEARKRVERKLAARERQLADAQHLAQIGSWNWDVDSGEITWSDELYRICGVHKATFAPNRENCRALVHRSDFSSLASAIDDCRRTGRPFQIEHRLVQPDGSVRTIAARGQGQRDRGGRVTRLFGTVQDITDAKLAEMSLRDAEERYRKVVELSPDAILAQQDGVIVLANPAAVALLGAQNQQQIVGQTLFEFLREDLHAAACERTVQLQKGDAVPAEEEMLIRIDGGQVAVEVNASPFLHQGRFAALYIMRDITERKKSMEQMAYLAHYDSLTGLPNRVLFHQRLEHALSIAERPERSLEVLFLDLDRFKHINDTLGHAAGDLVLKEAARRLQAILRESDTVARLGGDEFVVLVENVDEPHRGGIIAEKILAAFAPPFMRDGEPLHISTSIGISSFPTDGTDAATLLKNADAAMYRSKEIERNNYRYYSPEMNRHTAERLSLEYALGHAIERGQLALHYQPKIDVSTNRITGMEALLRWQHPTLGSVPPHKFIPVAEESGMIKPIGYWTIRTACLQNKAWQRIGPARLRVAVNLSSGQLMDDKLIDNIAGILRDTELDARYLELEITENTVMADPAKAGLILENLRDMGIGVTIDDFGVGYSSLAHLKRFPIRAIKIDRSFIQGLPTSRGDAAIAIAIIGLAHSLEYSVIAEGAETQQQYDFLREHDCDSVQGFYFSEPMPADRFADLIRVQSNLRLH